MVKFTVQQIRSMMDKQSNIRNVSVIAHVDHGKTTLTDSLIAKAGIISEGEAGDKCFTDTGKMEKERGITIKSTGVSLYYEREKRENKEEKEEFLVNLIDSPGHVDFSSEVTAALRVTDGALVVVDCVESVCVQTEVVLRQAIAEKIRPVLFLNKVDRIFLELDKDLEEAYQDFRKTVESANAVIASCFGDEKIDEESDTKIDMTRFDNLELSPVKGNVGFGSGYHAWAFTLRDFAEIYGAKWQKKGISLPTEKVMKKLWGDNYWDPEQGKFIKKDPSGKLRRTFVQFVLEPIQQLIKASLSPDTKGLEIVLESLGISGKLKKKDWELKDREFVKAVMSSWLPAGDALLDMMAFNLPSPAQAQKYRCDNLFTGPKDSELASYIRNCDPKGPVVMYISKMVKSGQGSNLTAFGRIFSGTLASGSEVRILDANFEGGGSTATKVVRVSKTVVFQAAKEEGIGSVPCGNLCGVGGISKFLVKSGTLIEPKVVDPYPIATMKFSVAPVVRVAVSPKDPKDLQLLAKGLHMLKQTDQLVRVYMNAKTGENIIAGAGELHLQICLHDLSKEFMNGAQIIVSPPVVSYCETVTTKCGADGVHPEIICAKSANKLNRIFVSCEPLDPKLVQDMEKGVFDISSSDVKARSKILQNKYSWDKDSCKRIWTWGPTPETRNNVLVDMTKGVAYLQEAKANIIQAFVEVCLNGVLCNEQLKGVRFNICDAKIHSDPPHRNAGQIIPASKRGFYGALLASEARFLEPMYQVDITAPSTEEQALYQLITKRRGEVDHEYCSSIGVDSDVTNPPQTGGMCKLRAFIPVSETFASKKLNREDFTNELRGATKGKAFPQTAFSHWQLIKNSPLVKGSSSYGIMMEIRERKQMKMEAPEFKNFHDRL